MSYPLNSVNTMLHNTVPKAIPYDDYFKSTYVDLLPARNLYVIPNTLGTNNTMSIIGAWGILYNIPDNPGSKEMI